MLEAQTTHRTSVPLSQAAAPSATAELSTPSGVPAPPLEGPARGTWRPKALIIAADALALAASAALAGAIFRWWDPAASKSDTQLVGAALVAIPLWLGIFANQRLYNTRFIGRRIDEFRRIINSCVMGVIGVALVGNLANVLLRRSALVILALTACVVITV